jgi:hypothetical protein
MLRVRNRCFHIFSALVVLVFLAGCSVSVRDHDNEHGEKNVDIKTPLGSLKVRNEANPADTGLSVYPGARRKEKGSDQSDSDTHAANVNISSSLFGVKVVAIEYTTDDQPDKVKAYYRKELGKWGKVLECPGGSGESFSIHDDDSDSDDSHSKELTCGTEKADGKTIELKAGTKERQHIVAVKPNGKGTDFGLVYVVTRGKEGEI